MVASQLIELHEFAFYTQMNFGSKKDVWALSGRAYGHPNFPTGYQIFVSTPVSFDEVNMIVTTASGRKYKLINPAGDLDETIKEIRLVIDMGIQ